MCRMLGAAGKSCTDCHRTERALGWSGPRLGYCRRRGRIVGFGRNRRTDSEGGFGRSIGPLWPRGGGCRAVGV